MVDVQVRDHSIQPFKPDYGDTDQSPSVSKLSFLSSASPGWLSFELGFKSVRILKDVQIPVEMKRYQQPVLIII